MKLRTLIAGLSLTIGPLLTMQTALAQTAQSAQPEISEAQLKELRKDITELQNWLKKAEDTHQSLVNSLKKSDEDVAEVSKKIEALRQKLKEERARLKKLQQEQRTLNKNQSQQQQALADIIRASYKIGQQPQLKVLLNQSDPSKLSRNMTYLSYLNQAHQGQIEEYRDTLIKLQTIQEEVEAQQASLDVQFNELKDKQKELSVVRVKQERDANKLNAQIKGRGSKLSRLKEDRQRLIELLGKVEEVFLPYERQKESRPFRQLKGKLPNPVSAHPNRFYGMLQDNGKQRWEGWLYKGSSGSTVHAIHHGRVVFSDWLRGFGLLTIVDHGQGYMSLYGRNQALLRSVGDWVEAGDPIAKIGRSGGFENDALYFEIRAKGKPVNPKFWMAKG